MSNKKFAERLNKELDSIGIPSPSYERIAAFAKLFHIPKFQAESFLNGTTIPINPLLGKLAEEFEVNAEWLIGDSDHRHRKAEN